MSLGLSKISLIIALLLMLALAVEAKTETGLVQRNHSRNLWESLSSAVVQNLNRIPVLFIPNLANLLHNFNSLFSKIAKLMGNMSSYVQNLFKSRSELAQDAKTRYEEVQKDVNSLIQVRNQIERHCLYPSNEETRSLCVKNEIEVNRKLQSAIRQRLQLRSRFEKYEPFL